MPTISYDIELIGQTELLLYPDNVNKVQGIFDIGFSTGGKDTNFYIDLLNGCYAHKPDLTVLFSKNTHNIGMSTLFFENNTVIVENISITTTRQGDYSQFVNSMVVELIDGPKYNIVPFMNRLQNDISDYYMILYVDNKAESYSYVQGIYSKCKIENIGEVFNFITKAKGYDKTKFPSLNMKWTYFKEAFVLRIKNNKIIKRHDDYAIVVNVNITPTPKKVDTPSKRKNGY